MPVAKKTATARRTIVREVVEPDRPEPLIRLKRTTVAAAAEERVLLFTKEYDDPSIPDREFWVPKKTMASLSLKFMRMQRLEGDNVAVSWAMEAILGEEAYVDLMEDGQLTDEELAQLFTLTQNALLGASKDPKGKSR